MGHRRRRWAGFLVVAALIAGCGTATPAGTTSAPIPATSASVAAGCGSNLAIGDSWISLAAGGEGRSALLHVPAVPPPPGARYPAIVALHGYSSKAAEFASYSGLSAMADREGFVVVYPQALGDPPEWHLKGGWSTQPELEGSDRTLATATLESLKASGCIDMGRVFLAGHSQGGGMAGDLACAMADRFAGAALVSGEYFVAPCAPSRPIPIVAFHAVDDPVLPYEGGRISTAPSFFPSVLPAERIAGDWATNDGCVGEPASADLADGIKLLTWQGCAAPVRFYRLPSGGHGWFAAETELLWAFFAGLPPA